MADKDHKHHQRVSAKRLLLGLSAGGVGAVILWIFHLIYTVNSINERLKEDKFKNVSSYIVVTDSIGKKDTIRLEEYLERMKHDDSLSKKY